MMTTNADVMNELANAAQSATALTQEVGEKVNNINQSIAELNTLANSTAQVILSKYQDPLNVTFYLSMNGDDTNSGAGSESALRTFYEAVSRVKTGSTLTVIIEDTDTPFVINKSFSINGITLIVYMKAGGVLEQGDTESGAIASIIPGNNSLLIFREGKIRTSINNAAKSRDTALIKREDITSSKAQLFRCNIELGNHDFMTCGRTANGLHELGLGHLDVKHRDDGNGEGIIALIESGNLVFSWANGTNSTGKSLSELFEGVVRATDGEPKNILSNVSI